MDGNRILGVFAVCVGVAAGIFTLISSGPKGEKGDPPSEADISFAISKWAQANSAVLRSDVMQPVLLAHAEQLRGRQGESGKSGTLVASKTLLLNIRVPNKGTASGEATGSVEFSKEVRSASVSITGYSFEFTNEEHPVKKLGIQLTPSVAGKSVTVTGAMTLSDKNGDDPFNGQITVSVLAILK